MPSLMVWAAMAENIFMGSLELPIYRRWILKILKITAIAKIDVVTMATSIRIISKFEQFEHNIVLKCHCTEFDFFW